MNDLNRWILQSLEAMVMIGLAVTSIVVVVLVVVPQLWEAVEIQAKISEDKERLNAVAAKLSVLSEMDFDSIRSRLIDITGALPEEFEVPRIIGTIKQLGVDTNLDVREVAAVVEEGTNSLTSGTGQPIKKQRVSLNVTADVEGMAGFLEELERVVPILRVIDVKASRNQTDLMDAAIMVESYAFSHQRVVDEKVNLTSPVPKLDAQDERLYEELKQRRRYELATASGVTNDNRPDPFVLER